MDPVFFLTFAKGNSGRCVKLNRTPDKLSEVLSSPP